MVDIPAHDLCPTRPPRPHRRRDIFHDGNGRISDAHAPCYSSREARTVYDNQSLRASRDHLPRRKSHQPQDPREPTRDCTKSYERKIVYRVKARDTFFRHFASPYPAEPQLLFRAFPNARIRAAPS